MFNTAFGPTRHARIMSIVAPLHLQSLAESCFEAGLLCQRAQGSATIGSTRRSSESLNLSRVPLHKGSLRLGPPTGPGTQASHENHLSRGESCKV